MYSAYGEFLSLANIDSAVVGIYKAYLDSVLIGLKIQAGSSLEYWATVLDFRRANLDPFTLPTGETMLIDEDRKKSLAEVEGDQAKRDRFDQANDYLYWFDLRAKFWDKTPIDEQLEAMVASSDDLLRLKKAAVELQDRRARALEEHVRKVLAPGTVSRVTAPPSASALIDPMLNDLTNRASIPPPPP